MATQETPESAPEPLLTGYSGRILTALSVGWLTIQVGRQAIPPLLPEIIDRLGLTPFTAGAGLTLMWICYAICHYPGGRLSDRLTRKTVLMGGLVILTAGFATLVWVRTYVAFLSALVLVGIGSGFFFITMRANLSDLYIQRRGSAFGLQAAAGNMGSVLGSGAAAVVLAVSVWQTAFLPVVGLCIITMTMLHSWSHEQYVLHRIRLDLTGTVRRVFGNRHQQLLIVAYCLFVLTWQGVAAFLPSFLRSTKGFSPTFASGGFALVFLVGMVVMPVSGALSDRFRRLRVAIVALVIELCGLSGLLLARSVPGILGSIAVFAAGLMAYPPVMQAYLMDWYSSETMGGDFGAFKTVYSGVGGFGPVVAGFVASIASYGIAFTGLACILSLCLLILGWFTLTVSTRG